MGIMPHSYGLRARTRSIFRKKLGEKGQPPLTNFYKTWKRNQLVIIKNDSAQQKGMTHRIYHGKVGKIFDIRNRAVGVEFAIRSREKQIRKRIYVRVEHLKEWTGDQDYLARKKENALRAKELKDQGKPIPEDFYKRQPKQLGILAQALNTRVSEVEELFPLKFDANIY